MRRAWDGCHPSGRADRVPLDKALEQVKSEQQRIE
jgi:hypothetical protein